MVDNRQLHLLPGDSVEVTWSPTESDIAILASTHPKFQMLFKLDRVDNGHAVFRCDDMRLWDGKTDVAVIDQQSHLPVEAYRRPTFWEKMKWYLNP